MHLIGCHQRRFLWLMVGWNAMSAQWLGEDEDSQVALFQNDVRLHDALEERVNEIVGLEKILRRSIFRLASVRQLRYMLESCDGRMETTHRDWLLSANTRNIQSLICEDSSWRHIFCLFIHLEGEGVI